MGSKHVAAAIWSETDVLERAWEREIECSQVEARAIIDNMDYNQDYSMGISWGTIDFYLDELIGNREEG